MTAGYVATWDGVASSSISELYITKLRRRMMGANRNQLISVPGRDGGWVFDERRGFRQITAECTVVAQPDLRHAACVDVADWLDKTGECKLIFSDQTDRYWLATLTSDPDPDEWRSLGKFTVDWTTQPYAYAITTSSASATASGAADSDTFTPADTIEAYPEIELTPLNGTLVNPAFTLNGDTLSYTGSVANGATITLSSISYTVTTGQSTDTELTGAYVVGSLLMSDVSGTFPLIVPGTNTWSLTHSGTATSIRVEITWRRRYR